MIHTDDLIDLVFAPNVIYSKTLNVDEFKEVFKVACINLDRLMTYKSDEEVSTATIYYLKGDEIPDLKYGYIVDNYMSHSSINNIRVIVAKTIFKSLEALLNHLPDTSQYIWKSGVLYWTRRYELSVRLKLCIKRYQEPYLVSIPTNYKSLYLDGGCMTKENIIGRNLKYLLTGEGTWFTDSFGKIIVPIKQRISSCLENNPRALSFMGTNEDEIWTTYNRLKKKAENMDPITPTFYKGIITKRVFYIHGLAEVMHLNDELPRELKILILTWIGRFQLRALYDASLSTEEFYTLDITT